MNVYSNALFRALNSLALCRSMPEWETTESSELQTPLLMVSLEFLVPKKGLEPPRPCGHMDLNHARLPVPPLRHEGLQAGYQR